MDYEKIEKVTTIGTIGGVIVSFAACAWICVNQYKLTKNTGRIADVLKYESMKK